MPRRRTLQKRLTMLYSGLFVASGVLLLAIANVGARTSDVAFPIQPDTLPRLPRPRPDYEVDRLLASSAIALLVMGVLSIALGWVVSGRALRPLRSIATTAREISATNLHARLDLDGPDDEIKELGDTLDALFARLEASFESQRHFVANASHELRTPLTAERALLQVALADPSASAASLRATCEEVLELGEQQAQLIDALLTLASSERGVERWEPVDLADLVGRVIDRRRPEFERAGVGLEPALAPAAATGDRNLLESLVANLVDNALRHNTPALDPEVGGGRVEISTASVDGHAVLAVRNSGPQVAVDDLDRLFEPFQRLGTERVGEGYGLGLAIVRAIADAHGATIVARPRPEGGLDVEIRLGAGQVPVPARPLGNNT